MSTKDRNTDGLKGVNFPNYFKNLTKSAGYVIDDILTENVPNVYNPVKAAANVPKKASATFRNINNNVNQINRGLKQSKVVRDVELVIKNAKSDLKSGKFYNKERKEKNDTWNFDFGDDSSNNNFSDDFLTSFDSLDMSVNNITNAVRRQSDVSVAMTSAQIANSNKNNVINQVMSTRFHEEIMESNKILNSNIVNLIEFNNDVMRPAIDTQLQFYTDSIEEQRKMSALLLEIKDIHTKVHENELKETDPFSGGNNSFNYDGTLNTQNYIKNVFSRGKGMVDPFLMLATMNSSLTGRGAIETFADSPLSSFMKFGIMSLAPKAMKNALKDLNTTFANIGTAAVLKANSKFDNMNPFLGAMLKEVFGISTGKSRIDISTYEKGKVPFDGITRKAITNVIPSLLSKIYTGITGINDNLIADYENGGKLVWQSDKEKEFKEQQADAGLFALYDFETAMKKKMDSFEFDSATQERLDKNFKEFLIHLRDSNSIFDINNEKYMREFNNKFSEFGNFYTSIFRTLKDSEKNSLASQQVSARQQYEQELKDMESKASESGLAQIEIFKAMNGGNKKQETLNEFISNELKHRKYADAKNNPSKFKAIFDELSKEYTKRTSDQYEEIEEKNKEQFKRSEDILESIRRTLVQGIIVFPSSPFNRPGNLPKHIKARLTDLDKEIAEEKRIKDKQTEKEMRRMQQSSGFNSSASTTDGVNINDLTDEEIASIINKKQEKEESRGLKTGISKVDGYIDGIAASKAGGVASKIAGAFGTVKNFIEKPFSSIVKITQKFDNSLYKLIYGEKAGSDNGKGLIANFIDGFFEKWDKVKNAFKEKVKKGISFVKDKWGNTQIGSEVNEKLKDYYSRTKDYFKSNKKGGFKEGFSEVTGEIKNQMLELTSDIKDTTLTVFDHFRTTVFGKTDKKKDNYNTALTKLSDSYKPYASDGIIGSGVGALASIFLPGGPLMWGTIGGLMNMSRRTGDFQKFLFGKDKNGERVGGLFSNNIMDKFKSLGFDKSKTNKLIAGGAIGGAIGLLPSLAFGPVTGAMLGIGTQFLGASTGLQEMLFGKKDKNGEYQGSKYLSKELVNKFPHMKKMGTIGALAGFFLPGGPIVNSILGVGLSYVKDTDAFKRFLWGDYDEETKTGKRGLFGTMGHWFKEEIAGYFGNFLKKQLTMTMATISKSIVSPFKHLMKPLQKEFANIGKKIGGFLSDTLSKTKKSMFSFLNSILFKPIKGLFTKVFGGGILKMGRGMANLFGGVMDKAHDVMVNNQVKRGMWTSEELYEHEKSRIEAKQRANEKILEAKEDYKNDEKGRKSRIRQRKHENDLYIQNAQWRESYENGFDKYFKESDEYKSLMSQRKKALKETKSSFGDSKEEKLRKQTLRAKYLYDLKNVEEMYSNDVRTRYEKENKVKFDKDRIDRRLQIETTAKANIAKDPEIKKLINDYDKAVKNGDTETANKLNADLENRYKSELANLGYHYTDANYSKNSNKINEPEFKRSEKNSNTSTSTQEAIEEIAKSHEDGLKEGVVEGFKNTTEEIINTFVVAAGNMKNNVINAFNKPDAINKEANNNVANSQQLLLPAPKEENDNTPKAISNNYGFEDKLIGNDFKEQQDRAARLETANLLKDIRNATMQTAENTEEMGFGNGEGVKSGSGFDLGFLSNFGALGNLALAAINGTRTAFRLAKGGYGLLKKGGNFLKSLTTKAGWKNLGSKLLGGLGKAGSFLGKGLGVVKGIGGTIALSDALGDIKDIATGNWEDGIQGLWDKGTTSGGIKFLSDFNNGITMNGLKPFDHIKNFVSNGVEKLSSTKLGTMVSNIGEKVSNSTFTKFLKNSASKATEVASKGKVTVAEWIEKMISSAPLKKVLSPIASALKKAAPKISAKLTTAAGKAMNYIPVVGWVLVANDVFTGIADYRNMLQLSPDSPYNATMSLVCGAVRAINNFVTLGVVSEKWLAELILNFTSAGDEMVQQQQQLKSDAEAAGFGDDIETFNTIENTTFWGGLFSKVPIVGKTKRKKIAQYIQGLNEELEAAQAEGNQQQVKKIEESLEKAQTYHDNTKESWWESLGSAVSNVANKAGNWLKKLWPFGSGGAKDDSKTTQKMSEPKVENKAIGKGGAIDMDGNSSRTSRTSGSSNQQNYVKPIADKFNAPLTSKYGWRTWSDGTREWHNGVDFGVPTGTPIQSIANGTVTISQDGYNGGWGNYVRIKHDNGQESLYAHQSKRKVEVGDRVKAGDIIGEVGNTGRSTGPHLHFGLYKDSGRTFDNGTGNGSDIDPTPAIEGRSMNVGSSVTSAANTSTMGTDYSAEGVEGNNVFSKFSNFLNATQSFITSKIFGQAYRPTQDSSVSGTTEDNTSPTSVSERAKNYKGETVDFSSLPDKQKNFFNAIQKSALQNYVDYGVLPSLTLAQAVHESGWGTSGLATKGKALFGIKPGANWTGKVYTGRTTEYYDGKNPTSVIDGFRAYDSWDDSIDDHGQFLSGLPRYSNVIKAKDYKSATSAIYQAGYATDPNYTSLLNTTIQKYGLDRADKLVGRGGAREEDQALIDNRAKQDRMNDVKESLNDMGITPDQFGMGGAKDNANNISMDRMSESINKINSTLTNYQADVSDSISRTLDAEYYVNQQITSGANWDKLMTILMDISSNTKAMASNTSQIASNTENLTVKVELDNINSEKDDNKSLSVKKQNNQVTRNIFLGKADEARQKTTNAIHGQIQRMASGN